jgi:predicted nucleic acid-binding Zn ribbon protein
MKISQQDTSNAISPHKHCPSCGKVISESSHYCSPDCELRDQERVKDIESIKFSMRLIIILVAVALILNIFLPLLLP